MLSDRIKNIVKTLPEKPGVYRYFDENENLLYVGKAKNLKKRVSSYFKGNNSPRITIMVSQIRDIVITTTPSEDEALLLENNLIKELNPKYNILFRDDKTYPYIKITKEKFPKITYYRGKTNDLKSAQYFGPYPNSGAINNSLQLIQKLFQLRNCEDSVFSNRSRPCLMHQIKRCSAPCVGMITKEEYELDVKSAKDVLNGKSKNLIAELTKKMTVCAENLNFELASKYRDQVKMIHGLFESQIIESSSEDSFDIVVVLEHLGEFALTYGMVKGGRHLGDRTIFIKTQDKNLTDKDILIEFIEDRFSNGIHNIITNIELNKEDKSIINDMINKEVSFNDRNEAIHKKWIELAKENCKLQITQKQQIGKLQGDRQKRLLEIFNEHGVSIEKIERIECFDISHTQGSQTVASNVVWATNANGGGMKSAEYRKYNITDIIPGDDYAAMSQVITRRFTKKENQELILPDLLLIDGGLGQVRAAYKVLSQINMQHIPMVGVAKGEGRKAGLETLVFEDDYRINLEPEDIALHLVCEIRDEAHRFAITGHRNKRGKEIVKSKLDEIEGIGPKKKKALLACFGSVSDIKNANLESVANVPGIGMELAKKIMDYLR